MRYRFLLDGQLYSKNKSSFKELLKKHKLAFKGSFGNFLWQNENEKVRAEFQRDEEKDVTLSATLVWEGRKKTEFMEELKAWVWELGGKGDKDETPQPKASEVDSRVDKELEFWDRINKPDVDRLKATGRPEQWIKKDVEDYRRRRRERKKELMERFQA